MLTTEEIQVVIDRIREYPLGQGWKWLRDAPAVKSVAFGSGIQVAPFAAQVLGDYPELSAYG
jgi:hypothetical protein